MLMGEKALKIDLFVHIIEQNVAIVGQKTSLSLPRAHVSVQNEPIWVRKLAGLMEIQRRLAGAFLWEGHEKTSSLSKKIKKA